MRSLAGLGMVALLAAGVMMSGCGGARIKELEFQVRQLTQQNENLQHELGAYKTRLAMSQGEASMLAEQTDAFRQTAAAAQSAREAELIAARAEIERLRQQVEDAMAAGPGSIALPEALDAKLKQFADAFPGLVTYEPRTGMVKYNNTDLLFELGSDKVLPAARTSLAKLAEVIGGAEAAAFDVVIVGHTDTTRVARPQSIEKFGDNWGLSAARARSVMMALKTAGVPETKMAIMGFGQFRPIGSEKARNRRVEIFFERANRFSPGAGEAPTPGPAPTAAGVPVP